MRNSVPDLAPGLRSRRALLDAGWSDRSIARAVDDGMLRLLRRNVVAAAERQAGLA